ncbi:hypothetical protein [Halarcobacter bivalviorum]|uniref:Lipoprotein n=1 Tax=Halarcobacter bivalviorum TaxID=663364 RepID=A0AAX2AA25_9BACT|nr:hypothetical protein [Halarcobacter bivalviorum]AXH11277.1 hypothetical protein ABIV_0242 [Halarcobacter bivalviorum]RXK09546.1 hypothetical protein CRV05_09580 [Halarcobacter bivalviorum]
MKIKNIIFLLVISLLLSGCGIGAKSYEVFEEQQNSVIRNQISMLNPKLAYIKQNYNENEYIYIKDSSQIKHIPKECNYGFITKKDDPKQIPIRWEILSGKEYCKQQQQWILSF